MRRPGEEMDSLLKAVVELAERAGIATMQYYEQADPQTSYKEDDSPLTQADLASHRLLVEGLRERTPDLPVLSEESRAVPAEERARWLRYWLVDPLDGTKEFLKHHPEFTVNVAMIERGVPVMGVVHAPAMDVTYRAARGAGAFKQIGGRVSVPMQASDYRKGRLNVVVSRSHAGPETSLLLRRIGPADCVSVGSSLKLCLVAEGIAHFYPRFGPTMEWDIAAAQCVVEEAGGSVTDLNGAPLHYNKPDLHNPHFVVCGNPPFPWRDYLGELPEPAQ